MVVVPVCHHLYIVPISMPEADSEKLLKNSKGKRIQDRHKFVSVLNSFYGKQSILKFGLNRNNPISLAHDSQRIRQVMHRDEQRYIHF